MLRVHGQEELAPAQASGKGLRVFFALVGGLLLLAAGGAAEDTSKAGTSPLAGVWSDASHRLWAVGRISPLLSWIEARDFCRDLTLQGLTGWRLPVIGELKAASFPPDNRAEFWSRSSNASEDVIWVLCVACRTSMQNTPARSAKPGVRGPWETSRALCVQPLSHAAR